MELLSTLLNELPAFIYWINDKMQFQGCNSRFSHVLGLSEQNTITGTPIKELLSGDNKLIAQKWLHNNSVVIRQTSTKVIFHEPYPKYKDFPLTCKSYKLPIKKNSNIVGLINLSFDITDQITNEKIFTEIKDDLEITLNTILSHIPGHVYWQDKKGIILGCNERQALSLGYPSSEEVKGRHPDELIPKNESMEIMSILNKVVTTGQPIILEEAITFKQGTLELLSHKVPLKNKKGEVTGILGLSIDISKQKKFERHLIMEKEKAEKSEKLKTDFIRNMEHDIRTPFVGVYGIINLLAEREVDSEKKSILSDVSLCAKELLDYCDSILDFSKIEAQSSSVVAKAFNLKKLVDSVMTIESIAAKHKKLDFTLNYDNELPLVVIGDPYRLKRILINLISNAIKFTKEGFVTLSISVSEQVPKTRNLIIKFSVGDSGIGIPRDKKELIYERFTRVVPSNKGLYKGQGLGLRIVKQFVGELDGDIHLKSEVGEGSTFTIFLAFKIPLSDEIIDEE